MTPYLIAYFGFGTAIMAFFILRTHSTSEPDGLVTLMAIGGSDAFAKILAAFIAPLGACMTIVLAWPAVLAFKALDVVRGFAKRPRPQRISGDVVSEINPCVFATLALLGHDYLCDFAMPFVITVALCTSWLVMKTETLLRTR